MYESEGANDKKWIDEVLKFWYNNNKSETQFCKCTMQM